MLRSADGTVLFLGFGYSPSGWTSNDQPATEQLTWIGSLDPSTQITRLYDGAAGHYARAVALPDGRAVLFVTAEGVGDPTLDGAIAQLLE